MIREFDAEKGSQQTAPSSKQSTMVAILWENRQNPRICSTEREFLDRLLDQVITGDEALAERIAQHPLLAWKPETVRRYKERGRDAA